MALTRIDASLFQLFLILWLSSEEGRGEKPMFPPKSFR